MPGILYIVATPIGNLEDMSYRAIRVLKEVDLIAAEDTRHTKKLLTHFGINTPLISYYREKELHRTEQLVAKMLGGETVALVSDAGTPAISDPGSILVRETRNAGLQIIPLPGPSALSAAVSCAGLETNSFLFLGFSPAKSSQRRKHLQPLVSQTHPLVFYESPHRVRRFIQDALEIFGDRKVLWAREISKMYEDIQETSLFDLANRIENEKVRGELVIIIHPAQILQPQGETIDEILLWYRHKSDFSLKDACKKIASDMDLPRSDIYRRALEIWGKHNNHHK